MIAQLHGTILDVSPTHIVLDVGGVGYRIAIRSVEAFTTGDTARLFTHLAVRENALDLYGFLTEEELDIFELLLKVPKIGPKSAMQILAQADIGLLKKAVATDDPSYLSKMSGIGKKSAEKIVLGLKDVFEAADFIADKYQHEAVDSDVIDALVALGYSQKDAREVLRKLPEELSDTNAKIAAALKHLGS